MEQQHPNYETEPDNQPRIYVASLSDYNAGHLHGEWIDATQEPEDIHQDVQQMLQHSPQLMAEEWAIHDYEGFGHFELAEYESFETVARIAQGICEHGDAFTAWIAYSENDSEEITDSFQDAYLGSWDSMSDYVDQVAEDLGIIREEDRDRPYLTINITQLTTDLKIEMIIAKATNGGIHVFNPRV